MFYRNRILISKVSFCYENVLLYCSEFTRNMLGLEVCLHRYYFLKTKKEEFFYIYIEKKILTSFNDAFNFLYV